MIRILTALTAAALMAAAVDAEDVAVRAYFSTRSLELSFSTDAVGAAPIREYQLFYTTDGGRSWNEHPERRSTPDAFPFVAPSDGEFGFTIVAIDAAGLRTPPPQPGTAPSYVCIVDTVAPEVRVARPTPTEAVYGGSDLVVEWAASDADLGDRPVSIEWRRNSNDPWEEMTGQGPYPAEGRVQWFSPLASGSLEIRVSARDRAGNVGHWVTPEPVRVVSFDGFRGSRALAADPYSCFRRFPLHYRITGFDPHEVAEVQIWFRRELGPWQRINDPDATTPYIFEAPDEGQYFFYLRAISKNRHADRPAPGPDTPADQRVVVDTLPPDGELLAGVGEGTPVHTAGEELPIQWLVHDENLDADAAKLEVSVDGGRHWRLLAKDLRSTDGQGSFLWRPPLIGSESTRFRLVVSDLARNRSVIDARSPVRLLNPRVDPKETAREHYHHAMVIARTQEPGSTGDRQQLARALEHLEISLLYDPNFAEAWHDRGVILRILGRHPEALESFAKGHRLRPAEVPFTFDLVRAHLDMVDQKLDPDGEHLANATAILASVSRESIYAYPPGEYRDLLITQRILAEDIADRRVAE
ncbi:MAG: hypothetical protein KDC38_00645 [Planctomycetes bacterium]|nr:hypothetical protein [Planctomycetota bacterium]